MPLPRMRSPPRPTMVSHPAVTAAAQADGLPILAHDPVSKPIRAGARARVMGSYSGGIVTSAGAELRLSGHARLDPRASRAAAIKLASPFSGSTAMPRLTLPRARPHLGHHFRRSLLLRPAVSDPLNRAAGVVRDQQRPILGDRQRSGRPETSARF